MAKNYEQVRSQVVNAKSAGTKTSGGFSKSAPSAYSTAKSKFTAAKLGSLKNSSNASAAKSLTSKSGGFSKSAPSSSYSAARSKLAAPKLGGSAISKPGSSVIPTPKPIKGGAGKNTTKKMY